MRTWMLTGLLLVGCGGESPAGGNNTIGQTCGETADCVAELDCLAQPSQDEWCDQESYCSVTCEGDEECVAALGEGHICITDCGATMCFVGSRN